MKIGYPCINTSIERKAPSTFRLAFYSENRLIQTVEDNLKHLTKVLKYNVDHDLLFFRISSDIVPFASHPICKFDWDKHFQSEFKEVGDYIKKHHIRISMHPDQFVVINSPSEKIVNSSINELKYHCRVLDCMNLAETAKIQIHVGGAYGNKIDAIDRFVKIYNNDNNTLLDEYIKRRLVIENDDRLYNLSDCLYINQKTAIPILLDTFHHECFNSGEESLVSALKKAKSTWKKDKDGIPMVDYSSQNVMDILYHGTNRRTKKGKHTTTIDQILFNRFLKETAGLDFDIMLEIKDKEKSALIALGLLRKQDEHDC
ncbi:MAG: UV DNA damage repair endonuclease UvsE [Nitrososphaeraceae archaeon]